MWRVLCEFNTFKAIASETKASDCYVCSSTVSLTWVKADIQLFMCSMKHHAMEVYGELEVQFQALLTSVQIMVTPTALSPRKDPPFSHWIGGQLGCRSGLEGVAFRKINSPAGDRRSVIHPAADHYAGSHLCSC